MFETRLDCLRGDTDNPGVEPDSVFEVLAINSD
jgi:hypothetical protein